MSLRTYSFFRLRSGWLYSQVAPSFLHFPQRTPPLHFVRYRLHRLHAWLVRDRVGSTTEWYSGRSAPDDPSASLCSCSSGLATIGRVDNAFGAMSNAFLQALKLSNTPHDTGRRRIRECAALVTGAACKQSLRARDNKLEGNGLVGNFKSGW